MKFIFIYLTNPTKKEARKVANHLLKKKLIACANIFRVTSLYWWKPQGKTLGRLRDKDKIKEEEEVVLIAKTTETNFEKVKKEVEKVHPYTIPCLIKIPVVSNKKYFEWLKSVIKE